MGGSRRRRPYAAFLPLSLRCLLQLPLRFPPPPSVRSFEALNPTPTPPIVRGFLRWVPKGERKVWGDSRRRRKLGSYTLAVSGSLLFSFSRTHFIHFSLALSRPFLAQLQK